VDGRKKRMKERSESNEQPKIRHWYEEVFSKCVGVISPRVLQTLRLDSLQGRLALWLSVAIVSVGVIAGTFAFVSAFIEAHELQDDMLSQVTALLQEKGLSVLPTTALGERLDRDPESRFLVQMLPNTPIASRQKSDNPSSIVLPARLSDGLHTVRVHHKNYRVMVRTCTPDQRLAVAQETEFRDEIARDSALRTLIPFLFLVPLLLIVASFLIRTIFAPITHLSRQIDSRSEQELHPIAIENFPLEVRPFVGAINRLFKRVDQSMTVQRRFVADAAHELRSPMTALSLQAERLALADMSVSASDRLQILRQGLDRARKLLDQLLTFARAQSTSGRSGMRLSVQQLYRQVLEDLLPLAEAKSIDIGITTATDALLEVDAVDLFTLAKNVVDNAIRYTPTGGRVDLSVRLGPETVLMEITDSGPGIPEEERLRVFDPFYRVLGSEQIGSGLGLSIVQTIAQRIGASITLETADPQTGSGLRVNITLARVNEHQCSSPLFSVERKAW